MKKVGLIILVVILAALAALVFPEWILAIIDFLVDLYNRATTGRSE